MHTDLRWWVAPPSAGESLGSLVQRVATLYEMEPHRAWQLLHEAYEVPLSDVDDPSPASLQLMAQALEVSPLELHRHRIEDSPAYLAPTARRIHCPVCRRRDLAAGQVPRQLQRWARVLCTLCPEHQEPLVLEVFDPRLKRFQLEGLASELSPDHRRVLGFIDLFAQTLDGALFDGTAWPHQWRGDAHTARQWLLEACFNTSDAPAHLMIAGMNIPRGLLAYVHAPLHLAPPTRHADWEAFRRIGDPSVRRAGLWLVAWRCIGDAPEAVDPGLIFGRSDFAERRSC